MYSLLLLLLVPLIKSVWSVWPLLMLLLVLQPKQHIDGVCGQVSSQSTAESAPAIDRTVTAIPLNPVPFPSSLSSLNRTFPHSYGPSIQELIDNFDAKLKTIRNTELGVPFVQEILDAMDFVTIAQNHSIHVAHMAERLTMKLNRASRIIKDTKRYILNTLLMADTQHRIVLQTVIQPCMCCTNNDATINDPAALLNTTIRKNFIDDHMDMDTNNIEQQQQQQHQPHHHHHQQLLQQQQDQLEQQQHYDRKQIEIVNYLQNSSMRRFVFVDEQSNDDGDDGNHTANYLLMQSLQSINVNSNAGNLKSIYYLAIADMATDLKCNPYADNIHLRKLITSHIKNKHILLLVDHGSSLNTDQLDLTKSFAIRLIDMLNEHDAISVVAISDKSVVFHLPHQQQMDNADNVLLNHSFYLASQDNKIYLKKFISKLNRTKDITNHTLGFQIAFQQLYWTNTNSMMVPILMIYVSRGLLSPLTEAKSVLDAIANGQKLLTTPVIINTCAIVLDEKRVMYEKQFLNDVAMQNYTKYNINVSGWLDRKGQMDLIGKMYVINRRYTDDMLTKSLAVFTHFFRRPYLETRLTMHPPVIDLDKDVVVSMSLTCGDIGLIGINMYLNDIAEDVIYYGKYKDSYAFLIDINGMVIWHPSYPRPIDWQTNPFMTHIRHFEYGRGFDGLLTRILTEVNGTATILPNTNYQNKIKYTWHRASHFYIICIVMTQTTTSKLPIFFNGVSESNNYEQHNNLLALKDVSSPELIYHRLDLIPPHQMLCNHFRQMATMESCTLFLSPSSFKSPFVYLKNIHKSSRESRIDTAKSIMAYIKDATSLLANPGLQPEVKNDVIALFHIMAYLKKRHLEGGVLQKYIIRRYVATVNGVMQIYPGCMLNSDMEPLHRPWFRKAMEHPGRIVMTEPYLDAGGAGHIVTISHTVFEGKSNALHNAERDTPVAIVSLDLTLGIVYKMLQQSIDYCTEKHIKCFLMEDKGFLVAHPSIGEPITITNNRNIRRSLDHITHKESYLANDILHHKLFVQKKMCSNYFNRTKQRFYQFNTSLNDILTNIVQNDRIKYQIAIVPGTNVFIGVVNSTSDGGAFCPCSTIDRMCLNCNRMEPSYCECPCECPLYPFIQNSSMNEWNEICQSPIDEFKLEHSLTNSNFNLDMDIKPCVNINCEIYTTFTDCLGIMGCEWCQVDVDGDSLFTSPFCTQQSSCFNGILGSITPYGDGDFGTTMIDAIAPPAYSAIGPVAGAIIALCLVIGFAMYCYRQNLESETEQLYAESQPENNIGGVPLTRLDFNDIGPSYHDGNGGGGGGNGGAGGIGDIGNHNTINRNLFYSPNNTVAISDISPYRINTGSYRRPNGESDHGYSTMTPHEDSEHMCFALAEPLINNKRLSISDSTSINTSISSPSNYNNHFTVPVSSAMATATAIGAGATITTATATIDDKPTFTILPTSPYHIQAPVTVHHPMEMSS